jgi:hypothetical protein
MNSVNVSTSCGEPSTSGVRWCSFGGLDVEDAVRAVVALPPAASKMNANGFAS